MNNTIKVGVHDMRLYARVGVFPEERLLKNLLSIHLEVEVGKHVHKYEGVKTINYLQLTTIIQEICSQETKLLEDLASAIIDKVKEDCEGIHSIHIIIRKLRPAMGFIANDVFVEEKWEG